MRAHVCVPVFLAAGIGQRGATAYNHHHYHLTNDTYGLSNATDGYHLDNATQPNITGMCAGNTDPAEDVACPAGFAAKRNATGFDIVKCCDAIVDKHGYCVAAMVQPECDASGACMWDVTQGKCVATVPLTVSDVASGVAPAPGVTPADITTEGFCNRTAALGMAVHWDGAVCKPRAQVVGCAAHASSAPCIAEGGGGCLWDGYACMNACPSWSSWPWPQCLPDAPAPVDCVESTAPVTTCTTVGQELYSRTTQASYGGKPCKGHSELCNASVLLPMFATIDCSDHIEGHPNYNPAVECEPLRLIEEIHKHKADQVDIPSHVYCPCMSTLDQYHDAVQRASDKQTCPEGRVAKDPNSG